MYKVLQDTNLTIATGKSRKTKRWASKNITWQELVNELSRIIQIDKRYEEFIKLTKEEQAELKDVGGFIGGLVGASRKEIKNRTLICLDLDNLSDTPKIELDFAYVMYSTVKHTKEKPRLRLVIPLSAPCTPEQYEPIGRKIAEKIGMNLFDDTTYERGRLMYWPTCCSDQEPIFKLHNALLLDPNTILSEYQDWRNRSEWAYSSRATDKIRKEIKKKQADPTQKTGVIGAFCRAYPIVSAIYEFLPDIYEECVVGSSNHFTYVLGSTAGGLVIYDDIFAYSHHSTDPAKGKLCNAFDLVAIHKFGGDLQKMLKFAAQDEEVRKEILIEDFDILPDEDWAQQLELKNGAIVSSIENCKLILQNDDHLKGRFRLNKFDTKREVIGDLPWRKISGGKDNMKDVDHAGIRHYVQKKYNLRGKENIHDALVLTMEDNSYHPIRDYLDGLKWDGTKRLDTIFIDYLGADDTKYTRIITRKSMIAAVKRVYEPGCKKDEVLVLQGPQGCGKSTILKKLGREWFSDTLDTMKGKEAYEQLQGAWIVELSELKALKKSDIESIKQFISKTEDHYRKAYREEPETVKRSCVFFGTTNDVEFLRDQTGNRRWWLLPVMINKPIKNIWKNLNENEVNQIWAEAQDAYRTGESILLDEETEVEAKKLQEANTETPDMYGIVEDYLNIPICEGWYELDLYDRREYLDKPTGEVKRETICALEVWEECYRKNKSDITLRDSREIRDILRKIPGWAESDKRSVVRNYGVQRVFTIK